MPDRKQLIELVDRRREHDYCDILGYNSRVSTNSKYIFIIIGKVAGTRILLTLNQLEGRLLPEGANIHEMGTRLAEFSTEEIVDMITSRIGTSSLSSEIHMTGFFRPIRLKLGTLGTRRPIT